MRLLQRLGAGRAEEKRMENCPFCNEPMRLVQQVRGIIKYYMCLRCRNMFQQVLDGKLTEMSPRGKGGKISEKNQSDLS